MYHYKTIDGVRHRAHVQCPYCKNQELSHTESLHSLEVGSYARYDCNACKAWFWNYPLRWSPVPCRIAARGSSARAYAGAADPRLETQ
jgi:hypothetical protein